jgi:hypothetical protein
MKARYLVPVLAAILVGGCTTSVAPIDVTRFHGASLPQRGEQVMLAPSPAVDANSIEFRTYANAVAAALGRAGFVVTEPGKTAPLTAQVDYAMSVARQDVHGNHSPVSVGVGGSTGSFGSGVGVGVGIDLSGPPRAVIGSRLMVRIKRTANDEALWEGRAETQAREGSPAAQPGIAAAKLADALFRDFPGQSGATITVR